MKTAAKFILVNIALAFYVYVLWSFINASWNIMAAENSHRSGLVFFHLMLTIVEIGVFANLEIEKQSKK